MKKNYLIPIFLSSFFLCFAQESKVIEYPFAEPGSEVTRGVFGSDDRMEVKDAEGYEDFVRATAVMIRKDNIYNNEFYSWSLRERLVRQFGTDKFDKDVRFLDQPAIGSCTGFLIAPDVLVTAGHCINSMEDANKFVWVFDYTSESDFVNNRKLQFKPENIYEVESIITSTLNDRTRDDYAVLKLTRKSERSPYRFRTSGGVLLDGAINTLGCPTGLPLKFSTNATVVDTSPKNWFKSNLDSFPGNSGGPVFDQNGFIEGILVRGAVEYANGTYTGDYKYDAECDCIKTVQWNSVNYTAGCQAHRITSVPVNALITAVYNNVEYAVANNLENRLNSWSIYNWIFDYKYTNDNGRFENLAIESGNLKALKLILDVTSEDFSDEYARELIDLAISKQNNEALKVLLKKGILADAGMKSKYSALEKAINNNQTEIAQTLIFYGANTNIKTSRGGNLLHLTAKNGNSVLTELLVKKGIDAGSKDNSGQRPEKIAKKAGYRDLAKYLKRARKGKL
ncbi:MAG: ankyrin repeat domain-containing protein [Bacteroidota bacterium]